MKQIKSAARNEAGTPDALFATLHREYRFTVDVCASDSNAKLDRHWTMADDGLAQSWRGERVWCNPPYCNIPPWLARAREAEFAAFLLPARTDRLWWMAHKPHVETHYFVGQLPYRRVQFTRPPGIPADAWRSNSLTNVLWLFGVGATAGHEAYRSGVDGTRVIFCT